MNATVALPSAREVRIALVCYGGASLAVYMHGVTKEIHRLVRASRGYAESPALNPFDGDQERSEHAYWEVLADLERNHGVPTRVVVDIISGTSAGGINGVCLAMGLALDVSQDALRDLWLDEADLGRLTPGPRWLPWQARLVARSIGVLVRPNQVAGLLDGDRMSLKLVEALEDMVGAAGESSLVPVGQRLDLFVTVSDYDGEARSIAIADRVVRDRSHRRVLHFRHDRAGGSDFADAGGTVGSTSALAFAARATSSFPGAFAPVCAASFTEVTGRTVDPRRLKRVSEGTLAPRTWLVDGGVLDNKPFGHAIAAIDSVQAGGEVQRWLVYVEPDPVADVLRRSDTVPGTLAALRRVAAMPRREPIIDELRQLAEHNDRVDALQQVMRRQLDDKTMDPTLAAHVGEALSRRVGDAAGLGHALKQARAAHDRVLDTALGVAAGPYQGLRVTTMAEALAESLAVGHGFSAAGPEARWLAPLVREALFERLDTRPSDFAESGTIRGLDQPFVERALRFTLAGAQAMYRAVSDREAVDEVVGTLGRALATAHTALDPTVLAGQALRVASRSLGPESIRERSAAAAGRAVPTREELAAVNVWLDALSGAFPPQDPVPADSRDGSNMGVTGILDQVELAALTALVHAERPLSYERQVSLVARYLGYSLWDSLVLPVTALTRLTELSPIRVARFSPGQGPLPPGATVVPLAGRRLAHFGAFVTRRGRVRDYLQGRLDGSRQLLGLLGCDAADRATEAILTEECAPGGHRGPHRPPSLRRARPDQL